MNIHKYIPSESFKIKFNSFAYQSIYWMTICLCSNNWNRNSIERNSKNEKQNHISKETEEILNFLKCDEYKTKTYWDFFFVVAISDKQWLLHPTKCIIIILSDFIPSQCHTVVRFCSCYSTQLNSACVLATPSTTTIIIIHMLAASSEYFCVFVSVCFIII